MNLKNFDFRHFLQRELALRQEANPSYSARAFARDLGTSSQMISQILRGKNGISVSKAKQIVDQLHLDETEKALFVALVEVRHHRHYSMRKLAAEKVQKLLETQELKSVPAGEYKEFLKWYFNPIILLVEMPGFKPSIQFISKKLNLDEKTTEQAIQKLFEKGLLAKDENGIWRRGQSNFAIKGSADTPEIRDYYLQYVDKAKDSILKTPLKDRDISMALINIGKSDLEEVQKEIQNFRHSLIQKLSAKKTPADQVYSLCIQFFPITSRSNDEASK